ncbi:MAG: hypothetical protein H5U08_01435 [Thermogutta sp.]|uniref:DUF7402 domain-containing protein n=1 Tax=Thermogutta sp. TaxID=1962930 RepID=UPI00199EC159|nr:hypothetical protein [Thermogutta sp.]MBC7350993.1 hypothetical protein [Thermogutta sp.]
MTRAMIVHTKMTPRFLVQRQAALLFVVFLLSARWATAEESQGLVATGASGANAQVSIVPAPPPAEYTFWPSDPPETCPIPRSTEWCELGLTGRHAEYTAADTWYPSWAADGRMYSCFTDGTVGEFRSFSGAGARSVVGHAIIEGDHPLHLTVRDPGTIPGSALPYQGRYPSANLFYQGIWYIGTYTLAPAGRVEHEGTVYNWPWLGPFVGFHISRDGGKNWEPCPLTPDRPLFGESALHGEPVKIGAAHVVDFGQEMQFSPDKKIYLVSHGASRGPEGRRFAYNSWITGDEVYLIRVPPGPENVNDPAKYEFYAGTDADGHPIWSKNFSDLKPIVKWDDHMGCVTITYNPGLKRYFMCVTDGTDTTGRFHSYLLESPELTGPYRMVKYLRDFGQQAYFLNIPSRFISADGKTMWLCYSANFARNWRNPPIVRENPPGSRYAMCLQEVRLFSREEMPPDSPLSARHNLARTASVTASSTYPGYRCEAACDGVVAGFPQSPAREWASSGESDTAFIRLTWPEPVTVDRVWLFDRPNSLDQITKGRLIFSDGTTIETPELPDDATRGVEIAFPPREVKWLAFFVTATKPGTQNVGLAELAVFGPEKKPH